MKTVLAVATMLLLQGCTARLAQNKCRTYGYQPGTEAFAGCTERMATLRSHPDTAQIDPIYLHSGSSSVEDRSHLHSGSSSVPLIHTIWGVSLPSLALTFSG